LTVTYSIALARTLILGENSDLKQTSTVSSNITLGSANSAAYSGKSSITISA
jgi:hypothetical protein